VLHTHGTGARSKRYTRKPKNYNLSVPGALQSIFHITCDLANYHSGLNFTCKIYIFISAIF
jgi:hypothetical protein